MAIADDFKVANDGTGDIRYTGDGATNYTVLEFKTYLGVLQAGEQASGDDLADITTETIYERSTDQILALNPPFNIDDTVVEHLYDGSVSQNSGDDLASGLFLVGDIVAGTIPNIIQNGKILAPYWDTGINGDSERIMKICLWSRKGGSNIDGGKIRAQAKEMGDTYAEFSVTLGAANATAALFTEDDINNEKTSATIEAFVGDIANTEGFQLIDVDGTGQGTPQEYYSQWTKGGQELNDVFEFTKWIQKSSEIADENNAETGDDWIVDDASMLGIGTEFSARDNAQLLTEARFWLKVGAGTPTGDMYCELYDSDDASPAAPTGSLLATSETLDVNRLTASYQETIFRFNDGYSLVADQEYFIIIRHPDGAVGDYIEADGDTTSGDDGNYAYDDGSWNGVTGDALRFEVKSSPAIHTLPGELFRGITHEIGYDGESGGPVTENSRLFWGTRVTYDGENGAFVVGEHVKIGAVGTPTVAKNGGRILFDDTSGNVLYLALDIITGNLADNDHIAQVGDIATIYAEATAAISDDDKAGGDGILLALDDNTGTGEMYLQVLTGTAPVEDLRISQAAANYNLATAVLNAKAVKPTFIGASTGTNLIGNYGIGPNKDDVGSNDKFTDLAGGLRTPENNVEFTVAGLSSGEDRVLVAPRTGAAMNKALYTLNGLHSSGTQGTIEVNEAIQTETPSEGVTSNSRIRVQLDNNVFKYQTYNSWAGSIFTIPSSDYATVNAGDGNDVFPAYIDVLCNATTEKFNAVHATNRDILIRVRYGGAQAIKTIESSAQFTSSPQTVTLTRTLDV